MSQITRRLTLLAALVLLLTSTLSAQIVPGLSETVDVSLVNVDVFVTDRDGHRVRGLTAADFEILENGKPQEISNFSEYASGIESSNVTVEGGGTEQPVTRREPRTIALFVEQMHLAPFQSGPFFDSVRKLLHETVQPGDAVSIVYWNRVDARLLEFTDDLGRIDRTLDSLEKLSSHINIETSTALLEEMQQIASFQDRIAPPGGVDNSLGTALPLLISRMEMKRRVAAINSLIATMGAGDGKKILLLATRRFGKLAGAEFLYMAGGDLVPNYFRSENSTEELTDSVIANANANGVTIYPLYTPGIGDALPDASREWQIPAAAPHYVFINETSNLQTIADRTGGLGAYAVSDIVKLMPEIAADTSDYYSLAYRVTAKNEDRARDIRVKAKNAAYRVRVRRQFVEKSNETRMKDVVTAALFTANPRGEFAFDTKIAAHKSGRRTTLPVSVRIPISALTTVPQDGSKHAGAFTVYVATAKDIDELSKFTHRTQPFTLKESDLARASAGHFTYDLHVVVNRDAKFLVVAVQDEVSKTHGVTRIEL